jgi:hypothetical protein
MRLNTHSFVRQFVLTRRAQNKHQIHLSCYVRIHVQITFPLTAANVHIGEDKRGSALVGTIHLF